MTVVFVVNGVELTVTLPTDTAGSLQIQVPPPPATATNETTRSIAANQTIQVSWRSWGS